MKRKPIIHTVDTEAENVDLELAVALGHTVRAMCGKEWVPTLHGEDELRGLRKCATCESLSSKPAKQKPRKTVVDADRPNYVYRCFDKDGRLIYVGVTVNPTKRLDQHRKGAWWADQIATIRLIVFPSREYALNKEREAIATEQPRWNVKGRWPYRDAWAEQDYLDYLMAIREGAVVIGTYSAKHIAEVQAELDALRFKSRVPA